MSLLHVVNCRNCLTATIISLTDWSGTLMKPVRSLCGSIELLTFASHCSYVDCWNCPAIRKEQNTSESLNECWFSVCEYWGENSWHGRMGFKYRKILLYVSLDTRQYLRITMLTDVSTTPALSFFSLLIISPRPQLKAASVVVVDWCFVVLADRRHWCLTLSPHIVVDRAPRIGRHFYTRPLFFFSSLIISRAGAWVPHLREYAC
jgi:hypothetical protein